MRRRHAFTLMVFMLFTLQTSSMVLPALQDALYAQRGGGGGGARGGGGRSAHSGSSVNKSSPSRSGSTSRSSRGSSRNTQSRAGGQNQGGQNQGGQNRQSAQRNNNNRRSASRNRNRRSTRNRSRTRARRVHRSRRFRRGLWIHHAFFHPRRFYRTRWVGVVFITVAAFAVISSSSSTTTYVSSGVTYYHINPWYRKVLNDGEEGYVLTTAPIGYTAPELPDGSETIEVDGQTYHYAEWSFWQAAAAGGYEVVEPPIGAEVSTIPEEAVLEEEGDVSLYLFDTLFFTQDTNDAGQTIYRVEPPPPQEEIDEIPTGSPSFEADGETYYYVNFSFYVEYEENGKTGYTNGEPEIGAQVDSLPDEVTTLEEDGVTYYQFDTVFFEEVEDPDGSTFYEVTGSPDGDDEEVEN